MRITEEDMKRTEKSDNTEQQVPQTQEQKTGAESRREKLKAEKKKLSELKGKKKLEYLWEYYKWVLVAAAGFLLVACVIVTAVRGASSKELLCVLMADAEMKDSSNESMATQIKQILDPTSNKNYVTIAPNCYTSSDGNLDYNSAMLMTVRVASGELDAVILPEKVYQNYNKQGMFLSVEKVEGKDFCSKNADIILKGNGISVNNNKILEKYGYEFSKPMVLAVCADTKHLDNCKAFITFLGYGNE